MKSWAKAGVWEKVFAELIKHRDNKYLMLDTTLHGHPQAAAGKGGQNSGAGAFQMKVLVVMSSAQQLELRDGKTYNTGCVLNELAVLLKQIVDAGYTPVFSNPNGRRPPAFAPASRRARDSRSDTKKLL